MPEESGLFGLIPVPVLIVWTSVATSVTAREASTTVVVVISLTVAGSDPSSTT